MYFISLKLQEPVNRMNQLESIIVIWKTDITPCSPVTPMAVWYTHGIYWYSGSPGEHIIVVPAIVTSYYRALRVKRP